MRHHALLSQVEGSSGPEIQPTAQVEFMRHHALPHQAVEGTDFGGIVTLDLILPTAQVEFMRHHALPYQAVEGAELDALRPQLAAVAEALGNFAFAGDVRQGAARDTFFKA